MKKTIIAAAAIASIGALSANAQTVEQPSFGDNWSIGIEGGVTTPMSHNPFFGGMRPVIGLHLGKQLTPVVGVGVEYNAAINTSNWAGRIHSSNAFDQQYLGLYGTADLFNLFGGYQCRVRPFTIEAMIGAGWGHYFYADKVDASNDWNFFATKAGLNFNFNVSEHVTIAIKPYVSWGMGGNFSHSDVGFNINNATFNVLAGVSYRFGDGFKCVRPYDQAEVNALNAQVNQLRGDVDAAVAGLAASQAESAALAAQLADCQNRAPKVVKEVNNNYSSVRFVFFRIGSSKITSDQQPNIEMIADYMKHHPKSKVVIKGYASADGNYDFNVKLAKNRAESVKNALISKYKIPADRITAEGEGIGHMFKEESWNRVSICTLDED